MPAVSADLASRMRGPDNARTANCDESLVAAFERVAATYPTSIALDSGALRSSYQDLNEAANRLASRLLEIRGSSANPIAILMDHDVPAIASIVGILKAGRITLGLNIDDPVTRLRMLMEDAEPSAIVVDARNHQLAAEIARSGCEVVSFESASKAGATHNPSINVQPGQTASLVYTSGATGRPKGVMQTHRQIRRNVAAHGEAMQYRETDRIPLLSAVGTGHGTTGVWCALLNGATLCPFPVKVRGVVGLADWIIDRGLTVFISSASISRALAKTIDSGLVFTEVRAVRLSSESVTQEDIASIRGHFLPECTFVHTLASSETGIIAWHRWTGSDEIPHGRVPVGKPSNDIEVLLLGDDGQPVGQGEIGEIAVRSRYLANGYWRDPDLTATRFSRDIDGHGTRIVRNGDWARINEDGFIEFCGRKDDRIKIRGNRVELADIESVFKKLPGITDAAAVAVPRDNHEPMLVAFVVLAAEASWSVSRLRHAAAANLPFHMVPSRIEFVDRLPLGAGGKIDRNALRAYRPTVRTEAVGEPWRTETETLLADIWAETLDVAGVAHDDDFFSLGGDSLKGAIVAALIHSAFGVEVSLSAIADNPTVSALAAFLDDARLTGASRPPIVPVPRNGPVPLSSFQERTWKATQADPDFVCVRSYRISGPLDVEILTECIEYLFDRHEILRTTFPVVDGRPVQVVHASVPIGFSFFDVSDTDDPEARAESLSLREAAKPIDAANPPLTRHMLIRLNEESHWLVRTTTTLVQDGWSFTILMNELAALYEAKISGAEPPMPKKSALQYIDYTVWHRKLMQPGSPAYVETLDWWKQQFPKHARAVKLPFRRSVRFAGVNPGQGVIHWCLDDASSKQLDSFARAAGATHFVARLACFVALVADVTGRSNVVIATSFANRNRLETRNIVGNFVNLVPLVFSYRRRLSYRDWLAIVRDRLFETEAHAEIPYEELYEQLRTAGLKPAGARITFTISSDLDEQRFGGLTVTRSPYPVANMPWGCQVYLDERLPANCRVDFNAGLYSRAGMEAMVARYVRLLETVARHPGLSIGRLVSMSSDNSLRRAWAHRTRSVSALMPS